jgi:phospholipid-binding lipoprotein MlaA
MKRTVGQTFGRWGMDDGAYVVLPFFGPRTAGTPLAWLSMSPPIRSPMSTTFRPAIPCWPTRVISDRAQFLKADKVIEEAALDKYSYVRDAYLQRRQSLIHDGNPPKFDPYSGSQEGKVSEAPQEGTSAAQVATRN